MSKWIEKFKARFGLVENGPNREYIPVLSFSDWWAIMKNHLLLAFPSKEQQRFDEMSTACRYYLTTNFAELMRAYPGRYVAIVDGEFFSASLNYTELLVKARQEFPRGVILIHEMTEDPEELADFR